LPDLEREQVELAQKIDVVKRIEAIKNLRKKTDKYVFVAFTASLGAAAIPIPGSGTVIITSAQAVMIGKLASLYSISYSTKTFLPIISSLIGRITARELLKLVPVAGNIANATIAGVLTCAIALYCIDSFEKIAIAKALGDDDKEFMYDGKELNKYVRKAYGFLMPFTKKKDSMEKGVLADAENDAVIKSFLNTPMEDDDGLSDVINNNRRGKNG
jgi:uncharacterized protein (DUF697 family)